MAPPSVMTFARLCVRKMIRRGHFALAGSTDVQSIFGSKDGVDESVTGDTTVTHFSAIQGPGLLPFRFFCASTTILEMAAQQRNSENDCDALRATENGARCKHKSECVALHAPDRKILDRALRTNTSLFFGGF